MMRNEVPRAPHYAACRSESDDVSTLQPLYPLPTEPALIGSSPAMRALRDTAEHVAAGDAKVLITGETGVGKDLVGRLIHVRSKRRGHAFVAVNCAAFSEDLLETELFGHVRGSFTSAYRDKIGKLQLADGGTLFLDEVGEMGLRMQVLLLRFLESGEIQPVGSDAPSRIVDVRIVAATNRNLTDLIAQGAFREDLMYRLNVIHIHVPPLRERRDDIRALIQFTLTRTGRGVVFSEDALQALERYPWPGNVRELQNVIEQVTWRPGINVVGVDDLPRAVRSGPAVPLTSACERRRQIADDLYEGLVARRLGFWDHVRRLFLEHEIAKHDLRHLMRRGLVATGGNYRAVLNLFGMRDEDYKRLLNFLSAHDCVVDFRPFRSGQPIPAEPQRMFPRRSTDHIVHPTGP
jgi:transcriptional regulator with PAS, ATPase and Fis domain